MKSLAMIVVGLLIVALLAYIVMAVLSQRQPDHLGLEAGKLKSCPDSPNCVCSEAHTQADAQHFIAPLLATEKTWQRLKKSIVKQGGDIQVDSPDYIHATFSTSVFHYVDDVELRFDKQQKYIHLRSASRIGRSDFGVNRTRIENLKKVVEEIQ